MWSYAYPIRWTSTPHGLFDVHFPEKLQAEAILGTSGAQKKWNISIAFER